MNLKDFYINLEMNQKFFDNYGLAKNEIPMYEALWICNHEF